MESNLHLTVPHTLYDDRGDMYIVRSTLGSGTYGTVVKAQMMRTSEIFAIKVMKNTDLQSFEDEVFILNEMQNGGKGQHIIPLVTSFIYDERPCLVFPLMQCSLLELLKKEGNPGLPLPMAMDICVQILHALKTMEEKEYVHGDVKLENIMVKSFDRERNKCEIVIIDLGLSYEYDLLSLVGEIQSLWLRAPEVPLEGPNKTKMDVWSVGCCLVELLTGEPLFRVASDLDLLSKIVELKGGFPRKFLQPCKATRRFFHAVYSQNPQEIPSFHLMTEADHFELFGESTIVTGPRFAGMDLKQLLLAKGGSDIRKEIRGVHLFLQNLLEVEPGKRWTAELAYNYISRVRFSEKVEPPYPLVNTAEWLTSASSTFTENVENNRRPMGSTFAPLLRSAAPLPGERGIFNANGAAGGAFTQAGRSQPVQSGNGFSENNLRGDFGVYSQFRRPGSFLPQASSSTNPAGWNGLETEPNNFGMGAAVPMPLRGDFYSSGTVGGAFTNPAGDQPAQMHHFRRDVGGFSGVWTQQWPANSGNHLQQPNPNAWSGYYAGRNFNGAGQSNQPFGGITGNLHGLYGTHQRNLTNSRVPSLHSEGMYSEEFLSGYYNGYARGLNKGFSFGYELYQRRNSGFALDFGAAAH